MLKGLTDHPLRRILSEEMHARKLPQIQAPARLMQLILQRQGDGERELEKLMNRMTAICPLRFRLLRKHNMRA